MLDPRYRTTNQHTTPGSKEDFWKFNPWRAPGQAPASSISPCLLPTPFGCVPKWYLIDAPVFAKVYDPCGMAGGSTIARFNAGEYNTTIVSNARIAPVHACMVAHGASNSCLAGLFHAIACISTRNKGILAAKYSSHAPLVQFGSAAKLHERGGNRVPTTVEATSFDCALRRSPSRKAVFRRIRLSLLPRSTRSATQTLREDPHPTPFAFLQATCKCIEAAAAAATALCLSQARCGDPCHGCQDRRRQRLDEMAVPELRRRSVRLRRAAWKALSVWLPWLRTADLRRGQGLPMRLRWELQGID